MNNPNLLSFESLTKSELQFTVGGDTPVRELGRAVGRFLRNIADGDNFYPPTFM